MKALRAPDDADECRRNAAAGLDVLRRYDIANVTSAAGPWWDDANTYALLLREARTGEPLGGVRVQRWGSDARLPIEEALRRVG